MHIFDSLVLGVLLKVRCCNSETGCHTQHIWWDFLCVVL